MRVPSSGAFFVLFAPLRVLPHARMGRVCSHAKTPRRKEDGVSADRLHFLPAWREFVFNSRTNKTGDFFDFFGLFVFDRKLGTLARLWIRLTKTDGQECPSYGQIHATSLTSSISLNTRAHLGSVHTSLPTTQRNPNLFRYWSFIGRSDFDIRHFPLPLVAGNPISAKFP